ncbi:hypothetical protein TRIUR3_26121 [Triticum urartu]|uniref:Uncharacterized protein n=1 Tax=Triticum urartu TaxID=4572 RepID=M8AMR8_TRIUA|nr:hypothetical protein TRIUR3_26121 [Triticum urartu]
MGITGRSAVARTGWWEPPTSEMERKAPGAEVATHDCSPPPPIWWRQFPRLRVSLRPAPSNQTELERILGHFGDRFDEEGLRRVGRVRDLAPACAPGPETLAELQQPPPRGLMAQSHDQVLASASLLHLPVTVLPVPLGDLAAPTTPSSALKVMMLLLGGGFPLAVVPSGPGDVVVVVGPPVAVLTSRGAVVVVLSTGSPAGAVDVRVR